MSILADLYSAIDTQKRRLKALTDDPLGMIDTGVRRFGEDHNALVNLMQNAYPMAGEKTVLNSPSQISQFQNEFANSAANQGIAAATVWHGSPHKFDKFDSSKIGTGEGAQAYGHGLYLAENPKVAAAMHIGSQGYEAALKQAQDAKKFGILTPDFADSEIAKIVALKDAKIKAVKDGSVYKVNLPDEHISRMLDWDKSLSQQHPDVQAAMQNLQGKDALGRDVLSPQPLDQSAAGQWAYMNIQNGRNQRLASEALAKQGIPGIRYLDQGSRGAGTGTSNYVVFPGNEDLLRILERNGQPMNKLSELLK